jgi:hypothetical protein
MRREDEDSSSRRIHLRCDVVVLTRYLENSLADTDADTPPVCGLAGIRIFFLEFPHKCEDSSTKKKVA